MSSRPRVLLFLLAVFYLIPVLAQANTWDLDSISQSSLSDSSVDLTTGSRTVTKLNTSQIRMLLDTRDRISAQSDTYAKVLISDEPMLNAWAISANGAKTVTLTLEMCWRWFKTEHLCRFKIDQAFKRCSVLHR